MTELTIIAAIAANGVIGRTSKTCDCCNGCVEDPADVEGMLTCSDCNGTCRVPCNDMPWSYPEHDARVEALTAGQPIVFGRGAWEALTDAQRRFLRNNGGISDERFTHVVSKTMYDDLVAAKSATRHPESPPEWSASYEFHAFVPTLTRAIERLGPVPREYSFQSRDYPGAEKVFIRGGAQLFAAALPLATTLELTLIDREWPGEIRFPWSEDATDTRHRGTAWTGETRVLRTHGARFDLVTCEPCPTNPDLTFTTWKRRA